MGGALSGRSTDKPLVEDCRFVDLVKIMRVSGIKDGGETSGTMSWFGETDPQTSAKFYLDLRNADSARLVLRFAVPQTDGRRKTVQQKIMLTATVPNYGGRRWWMRCPVSGERVRKLYLPPDGNQFAGRKAWNLGYRVERLSHVDRPFEKLFRAQRKLGCEQGLAAGLARPKGMWRRTYVRHLERFAEFDLACAQKIFALIEKI